MREVTMLFADLRGFTPMVEEALPPKDVVKIMNRYFVEMSAAIREQKRLVLQYIGGGDRVIYSLVGDTVNLASRLQSLNKQFNTDIIISARTQAGIDQTIPVKQLPPTPIKGKMKKIDISSLL
jgi:class 3 adenylate cyclase